MLSNIYKSQYILSSIMTSAYIMDMRKSGESSLLSYIHLHNSCNDGERNDKDSAHAPVFNKVPHIRGEAT